MRCELADLAHYVDWIDDWLASDFIVGLLGIASNTTHKTTHAVYEKRIKIIKKNVMMKGNCTQNRKIARSCGFDSLRRHHSKKD